MILDATAGNRTMWEHKRNNNTIYIDIEKKLEVPPTIWASNECTPFPECLFDVIFYDPPHNWGGAIHYFSFPNKLGRQKYWPKAKGIPTYYGWDKYKTRNRLIKHIYNAQIEFQRILKPDGLLWFKWNEMRIPLHRILGAFAEWHILLRLYIQDPSHTAGHHQTYWICMTPKTEPTLQRPLAEFVF